MSESLHLLGDQKKQVTYTKQTACAVPSAVTHDSRCVTANSTPERSSSSHFRHQNPKTTTKTKKSNGHSQTVKNPSLPFSSLQIVLLLLLRRTLVQIHPASIISPSGPSTFSNLGSHSQHQNKAPRLLSQKAPSFPHNQSRDQSHQPQPLLPSPTFSPLILPLALFSAPLPPHPPLLLHHGPLPLLPQHASRSPVPHPLRRLTERQGLGMLGLRLHCRNQRQPFPQLPV